MGSSALVEGFHAAEVPVPGGELDGRGPFGAGVARQHDIRLGCGVSIVPTSAVAAGSRYMTHTDHCGYRRNIPPGKPGLSAATPALRELGAPRAAHWLG